MSAAISVQGLTKTYQSGFTALAEINLEIEEGEIFALLGPNGAGKTTLINIVCGIVTPTNGTVSVSGHDIQTHYRLARDQIGLVPQELTTEAFETVYATVRFSRGLFGKKPDPNYIEQVLRDVSLWDKRDEKIMNLSGGMKRRVLIAKALAHEPAILFLDEPTAGVDISLRKEMWYVVRSLKEKGVTIILTTHYIEEAEEMADRIGIIRAGTILLTEKKDTLMKKLGQKQLCLTVDSSMTKAPDSLSDWPLEIRQEGDETKLIYTFDAKKENAQVPDLLKQIADSGVPFSDIQTRQSTLEEIFVGLVSNGVNV